MKTLSSREVRQMYLDFFAEKGHKIEPSASLVPVDDPTLLWINSGVATLKKYFDGSIIPDNPKLTNAQKSIRTNDIENVGKTARHHTLFEMLGNFSIGDYFKEDAIAWAWELLTSPEWYGMDSNKLYVTVNPKDEKAKAIWLSLGVPENHIVPLEDNFWDIGAGPSGPNTEIFYDRGQSYNDVAEDDPENYPGGENERYLEIWNIVFSEFNHNPDGTYTPLPKQNIDTGMGLERVVSLFQDAPTNFETDLFLPIIEATVQMSDHKKYGINKENDISFKVIADHVRAVSFAIGDGALPSNEGRGYVLRRLLRRAVMHGKKLGIHEAFMYKLVPVVGEIMGAYYSEINDQKEFIQKVIRTEEERFHETINDGLAILSDLVITLKKSGKDTIAGKDIFKLYDTYGFPVELTEEYAEDNGLKVDRPGFETEMTAQRDRARAARSDEKSMNVQTGLLADIKVPSAFIGYTHTADQGTLEVIVHNDTLVSEVTTGEEAQLIFHQTPFYAEMGGQIADQGVIKNLDGAIVAEVKDVQKAPNGQMLHIVNVLSTLEKGTIYELEINNRLRQKITKNHTATHLLHRALKEVLGEHANQAGSLVTDKGLRFDFTHFGQVTKDELVEMERIVNEKIWESLEVVTVETDIDTAKDLGAMALFGEKYGELVRVVDAGGYSIELCGGVHVANTNEIGLFKLISESGIGAGVRRIEAVTSREAYLYLQEEENRLKEIASLVKAPQTKDTKSKIEGIQQELKEQQKENESLQAKLANDQAGNIFNQVETVQDIRYIAAQVEVKDMNQLRQIADQWKQKDASDILVLATTSEGKVSLLAAVNEISIAKGFKAGELIKNIAPIVGGGGGGRPDMAQAGGKNPAGISEALQTVATWIMEK